MKVTRTTVLQAVATVVGAAAVIGLPLLSGTAVAGADPGFGWGLPGPGVGGWGGPFSGIGVLPGLGAGLPGVGPGGVGGPLSGIGVLPGLGAGLPGPGIVR